MKIFRKSISRSKQEKQQPILVSISWNQSNINIDSKKVLPHTIQELRYAQKLLADQECRTLVLIDDTDLEGYKKWKVDKFVIAVNPGHYNPEYEFAIYPKQELFESFKDRFEEVYEVLKDPQYKLADDGSCEYIIYRHWVKESKSI